jgi:alpha-N-arabinofuranosidase
LKARASLHRDFVVAQIDDRIYGGFLEHLGRAIYGGIYEPGHPTADGDGFRRDVLALLDDLAVPIVRYPGGNFVSAYNWEDGVGPRAERPVRLDLAWRTRETNEIGIDEFARWCTIAKTEMMLAVNLGSRGIDAARNLLEYCNHPGGSYWSDLRRRNGTAAPHDVRLWCLGNEMDGPWQIGRKTALEYGRLANETAKAMRAFDPKLELVVCGSSSSEMPTYPQWEAEVLDQTYDNVEHISLHMYFENYEQDFGNFLAKSVVLDRYIRTVSGVIDYIKARKRSKKNVFISFDEWNVWYHDRREHHAAIDRSEWPVAPPLIEEAYNMEDVLIVGSILNSFLRHADRVKIACIAQLVNVIAPIMTETGGRAWRQTIYYPYLFASKYGRGTSLAVALDVPAYSAKVADDVPYLDVAAVRNSDGGHLTLFAVNRHPDEEMEFSVDFSGFAPLRVVEHLMMADSDLQAVNTAAAPDRIVPRPHSGSAIEDRRLVARLPAASYHVIRVGLGA